VINESALILAIAAFLDYLIGDPWNWLHPVQVMGWVIQAYSQWVFNYVKHPGLQKLAGVGLGILLIGGSGAVGWSIVWALHRLHPIISIGVQSVLLASCFAARSLRAAAEDVLTPLSRGEVAIARSKLSLYVGRDTEDLTEAEIFRAVLETVTENATDGVLAPLFYAIVGALLPVGSVPLALAYKAASTLDSMVGYREAPYTHLGWFSAKTEDLLTWLPCRLVVLTLSLLSRQPRRVWQVCWRDARQDPSPNAGWSECAYATVLGVQMGGVNQYRGVVKHKPLLGDALRPIKAEQIEQAMRLTRYSVLTWLAIALLVMMLPLIV
jgi:adenosylcobinamide-phosphate synthase